MSKTALILVDIQNDYFEGGKWPVDKMQEVSANAARLLQHARNKGQLVIHIRHENPSDNAPFFGTGSSGAEIHSSVAPIDGETVIVKHKPNSFQDTALRQELDSKGVGNVVICGAMSQMCIDATTRAAFDFDYAVTVIEDACGAKELAFNGLELSAPQVHAAFMAPLAMGFARVVPADAYLAEQG